jgi:fibronectin type III domain protein/putative pyrroloquinoline-quinone binding quinoprotein
MGETLACCGLSSSAPSALDAPRPEAYTRRVRKSLLAGLAVICTNSATAPLARAATPLAPTELVAVAVSTDQAALRWTISAADAGTTKIFNIYRNDGPAPVATSRSTSFLDSGLAAGTTYSYTVSACAAAGKCSERSLSATIATFKWIFPGEGSGTFFTPAIGKDGTLFAVRGDGGDAHLYAVNPDGTKRWTFGMNGRGIGSPVVDAEGNIYAASTDTFYSVSSTGSLNWIYHMSDQSGVADFSPALGADGTIYIGIAFGPGPTCGFIAALTSTGTFKWKFSSGAAEFAPAVVGADGTIYAGAYPNTDEVGCGDKKNLYAIDPDGGRKWAYTDGNGYTSLAIDAGGNIDAASGSGVVSLTSTAAVNWAASAGDFSWISSPAIDVAGNIYAASGNALYSIGPTGAENWVFTSARGNYLTSPALAANGTIYTGTYDGPAAKERLFAMDITGLNVRALGAGEFTAPTIGPDGTIYAGDAIPIAGSTSTVNAIVAIPGKSPLARSPWPKAQHDARNTGRY